MAAAETIREALARSMVVRWQVRQMVCTVRRRWLETVFDSEFERPALDEYERLCTRHPTTYFEFVAVATAEECVRLRTSQSAAAGRSEVPAMSAEQLGSVLDDWAVTAGTCFVEREGGPVSFGSLRRADLLKLMQLAQAERCTSGETVEASPGVEPG